MPESIDPVELQIELFGLDMQDDIDAWARKLSRQSALFDIRGMSETDKLDLLERQIEDGSGPFSEVFDAIKATVAERSHFVVEETRFNRYAKRLGVSRDDLNARKFKRVAMMVNTCPDCIAMHGLVMTLAEFEASGMMPTQNSVCGANCMCQLIPVDLEEELGLTDGVTETPIIQYAKKQGDLPKALSPSDVIKGMTPKKLEQLQGRLDKAYERTKSGKMPGGEAERVRKMMREIGRANAG